MFENFKEWIKESEENRELFKQCRNYFLQEYPKEIFVRGKYWSWSYDENKIWVELPGVSVKDIKILFFKEEPLSYIRVEIENDTYKFNKGEDITISGLKVLNHSKVVDAFFNNGLLTLSLENCRYNTNAVEDLTTLL